MDGQFLCSFKSFMTMQNVTFNCGPSALFMGHRNHFNSSHQRLCIGFKDNPIENSLGVFLEQNRVNRSTEECDLEVPFVLKQLVHHITAPADGIPQS